MTITNTIKTSLNTTAQDLPNAINELEAEGLQDKYEKGKIITLIDELTVRDVGSTQMFNLYSEDKGGEIGVENTAQLGNAATVTMNITSDIINVNGDTTVNGNFETDATTVDLEATGTNTISGATVDINGNIDADGTTIDLNATGALNLTGSSINANGVLINKPSYITTSDDGATSITATSRRQITFKGSGTNHVATFAAWSTFSDGDIFTIKNASDNTVGLMDTDGEVWERILPGKSCIVEVIDKATPTVIVDNDNKITDPSRGWTEFNNFYQGASVLEYGDLSLVDASTGDGITGTNGVRGDVFYIRASSVGMANISTVGYGSIALDNHDNISSYFWEAGIQIRRITGTDDVLIRFGFIAETDGSAVTEGAYLEWDTTDPTNGAVWRYITTSASTASDSPTTSTPFETATAVNQEFQRLRIEKNLAGTRYDFWVGETHVGSHTTNLPNDCYLVSMIEKQSGTSAAYVYHDWVSAGKINGTRRGNE